MNDCALSRANMTETVLANRSTPPDDNDDMTASPDETPSPEALLDLPVPTNPRISPSGTQIIYQAAPLARAGEHPSTALWLASAQHEHSARQFTSGQFHDRTPQWCPRSNADGSGTVSFLSDRAERGKSVALYCMHVGPSAGFGGGEAYAVTPGKCEKEITSYAWGRGDAWLAFVSADKDGEEVKKKKTDKDDVQVYGERWEYARLRLLHLETRAITTLYSGDEHVTTFSWCPAGKQIVFVTQPTPEIEAGFQGGSRFRVLDLASRTIVQTLDFGGGVSGPVVWGTSGIFFLAGVKPDSGSTSQAVYELDLAAKTTKRVLCGETNCAEALLGHGGKTFALIWSGMRDIISTLDGNELLVMNQGIVGQDVMEVEGEEHPLVAYSTSSVDTPQEIFVTTGKETKVLSTHGKQIAAMKYASLHPLDCKSYDGTAKLEGYYVMPKSHNGSKPLPTLVTIHGGPYYRRAVCFDPTDFCLGPPLLAAGRHGILAVNYRGGAGYGEQYASPARGGMGTKDYDDVIALVEEGIRRGYVDKSRIIVSGWSQGGFLSYLSAVRNSPGQPPRKISDWNFSGAICGAGVVDWDLMAMSSDLHEIEGELAGGLPWTSKKTNLTARHGSPIWEFDNGAKNIPPMLLLHGERDVRVPVSNAVAFHRGCLRYKIPCELAVYPREPHAPTERAHVLDMMDRVKRFVDTHIAA